MLIVSTGDNFPEMSNQFSEKKNKKNITNLLSAELAIKVVKADKKGGVLITFQYLLYAKRHAAAYCL